MKCVVALRLFCLYGAIFLSEASLQWSKSYSLKAILTVPEANLSEPYQVWIDGDASKSRVDFYDGMDKLYRQWSDLAQKYEYVKIHPETTEQYTNKEVCHVLPANTMEIQAYVLNTYLPVKDFKFIKQENVNSVEAQKWEYSVILNSQLESNITHTVWVSFRKSTQLGSNIPVPVRYDYKMNVKGITMDYFRHDYSHFDDSKPGAEDLKIPSGMKCAPLAAMTDHEPFDPLLEYVEPLIEHSRVSKVFDGFTVRYNKNYGNDYEHFKRMNIFKNNLRYINSINRHHRSFRLAINHLADLTDRESLVFMGTKHTQGDIYECKARKEFLGAEGDVDDDDEDDADSDNVNTSLDWRDYGAVSPVKDQTTLCGACYAFTTAAAVESAAFVARGCRHLDEVSEQALVDCTWSNDRTGNLGCSGGTYEYTLNWIKNKGIPLKAEYGSYLAMEGRCHSKNMTKLVKIKNYTQLMRQKRIIKQSLRDEGPLLATVDGAPKSFRFYSSGIYDDPKCRTEPEMRNHGVTLIGYGKESDKQYWIIKNSYGVAWGEQGYMRLATKDNVCGLKNFVNSVQFKKTKSSKCFENKKSF